ncbi:hypothetical protein ACIQWN_38535 [Streptomyces vinaceus]|uniref:hypothetical protein n=1 Tax=Streptomyces vinaceus TaxID=1960 RepID=UPI00381DF9D7
MEVNNMHADWSCAPAVEPGIADDFYFIAQDEYMAMDEEGARGEFMVRGLDWDAFTPVDFADWIARIEIDREAADSSFSSACFVFCDKVISDPVYRVQWKLALLAAKDVHEEED